MAAKKGAPKTLQTEINTSLEWHEFLQKPGLLVVDVYSTWSGPCTAMISTLRKIKFEIAGDLVNYAIANNESIEELRRFRYTCEPVWMFLQNENMVNFMYGADCPAFKMLILHEIERVRDDKAPTWYCLPEERAPEEQARWEIEENERLLLLQIQQEQEEEEKALKYEAFLNQMMYELCEETAIMFLPGVFFYENGDKLISKERVQAYSEIKNDLLLECFDIVEERELNEKSKEVIDIAMISGTDDPEINEKWKMVFQMGACLVLRLRGRPPHPDWIPEYPNVCPDGTQKCPVRAINDVENYLISIVTQQPPPLISTTVNRRSFPESFMERHFFIYKDDETQEEIKFPSVWYPENAVIKVEFFNTVFRQYMDRYHPYVVPEPPLPICGFKFKSEIFEVLRETCSTYSVAIDFIGVYEYDRPPLARRFVSSVKDFVEKFQVKTGLEIMVVIIRRMNEETFLSFAGAGAYFISEDEEEVKNMVSSYFPPDAIDVMIFGDGDEEEEWLDRLQDEEEFYGYGEGENFGYGVVEE